MGCSDLEGFSFRTPDFLRLVQQPLKRVPSAQSGRSVRQKKEVVGGRVASRMKMASRELKDGFDPVLPAAFMEYTGVVCSSAWSGWDEVSCSESN